MSPELAERASQERLELFRWLVAIGLLNLMVLSVIAVGITAYFNNSTANLEAVQAKQIQLSAKLRASNIASCERGNTAFAREVIEAGQGPDAANRQEAALRVLQFRDCERTEETGQVQYLSKDGVNSLIYSVAILLNIEDWDKRYTQ